MRWQRPFFNMASTILKGIDHSRKWQRLIQMATSVCEMEKFVSDSVPSENQNIRNGITVGNEKQAQYLSPDSLMSKESTW